MAVKHKDYLTTREAALLLNVAVSTIQLWTNDGLLEAWTTVGGHRRISKTSVEKMLDSNKVTSIVIVEDNESEQSIFKQHFELWNMGNNISICKDGYAGLMRVGQFSPEIIITDLMMPNMNGFEMIKAIKENSNLEKPLIIVVSGLTNDEIKLRGELPPDVLVFKKPVRFEEMEILIRKRLSKSSR